MFNFSIGLPVVPVRSDTGSPDTVFYHHVLNAFGCVTGISLQIEQWGKLKELMDDIDEAISNF